MATRTLGVRVGARLRARRESIGWSQAQLAEAVGLSPNYVGVVERGEKLPTLETLDAFARALGTSPGELLLETTPDAWADEIASLARGVPALHRRLVLAVLKTIASEARLRPRAKKTAGDRRRD